MQGTVQSRTDAHSGGSMEQNLPEAPVVLIVEDEPLLRISLVDSLFARRRSRHYGSASFRFAPIGLDAGACL